MEERIRKVIARVKTAQKQLQTLLKNSDWVDEARKYAEQQGKELRKILAADSGNLKNFLERERKELERFQKQIPGEIKKFFESQRKEVERLLSSVRKVHGKGTKTRSKKSGAQSGTKSRASRKRKTSSSSASTQA